MIDDALAALSPEQRTVLELLLRRERAAAPPTPEEAPVAPRADRSSWPLSFSQQRLWFLDQLTPGDPAYNIHGATRLSGPLRPAILARSLGEIVARHEVLRARFTSVDGEPEQSVASAGELPFPVIDLGALPAGRREAEVMRLVRVEARQPFDLSRGPLLRAALIQEAPGEAVLLVTMHHIVADGWSIGVLLRELSALYPTFAAALQPALPPPVLQYADFAAWQRGWLRGARLERAITHWRQRLAGMPELRLPGDVPGEPDRDAGRREGSRGGAVPAAVPAALIERLRAVARGAGASLFMALLAAFELLLSRWSGQRDFSVGTPVANRTRPEIEGLIGFFVNTLVLRADLAGDPTFRELLERVREAALDAFAHQELPFEKLVEELQPERRLGRNPLFSAMLALQNAPARPAVLPGISARALPVRNGTVRFDLTLALSETEGGLEMDLEHRAGLLSGVAARRMTGHFLALLEAVAADPSRPLSELPILTAAESHQIRVEWAGPERAIPEGPLWQLFTAQAAKTPDDIAVVCAGRRLAYGELDRRSNQLARHLRRLGAGPETAVAICVERSPEMVIGLLGILKAGAAYLPVDPYHPPERRAAMVEDGGAPLLLTQGRWAADFARPDLTAILLDPGGEGWELIGRESAAPPEPLESWANPVALLYTSGSTGRPKATVIPGHGLLNLCAWYRDVSPVTAATRSLLGFAFSFDAAFKNIVVPLLNGGRTVLPDPGPFDAAEIWSVLGQEEINFFSTTPSQLLPVLHRAAAGGWESLASLETLILAGEAAPWAELRPWLVSGQCHAAIVNMYGPSECSDIVSSYRAAPGEVLAAERLSVGRAADNTRLTVLDPDLQLLPVGVPGELYIAGAGLARGYLGLPGLTAEKFIPDPFVPGERMYRSGDLARFRPDGNLELLGRRDDQVKIRGVRVEPGEVEAALLAHPGVQSAVVLPRRTGGEVRLVAWIVPAEGAAAPSMGVLRELLQRRLPAALVPAAFVELSALPLSPHGKLDRAALPEPGTPEGPEARTAGAPPRDPAEELMAALFAQVLDRETAGVHDNFFHLGGHSLLATRLASRVRAAFGVEMPVRRIFESPTPAELAAAVREDRADAPAAPPLRRWEGAAESAPAPLSFAQQRLWVLHQLTPGLTAYHLPASLRLNGRLDTAALRAALSAIAARHEALRTRFTAQGGDPLQVIDPPAPVPLPEIDLSALPEEARTAAAGRLAAAEARRPFDLERGPLLRLRLVRLGAAEHLLLLNAHHLVSDGWSTAVFLRELSALYAGGGAALPPLPVQYADYAVWQRGWLRGEALAAELAYWRRHLDGAPELLALPTDRPRPAVQSFRGATSAQTLPAELAGALGAAARARSVTPFMLYLTAFQVLLGRWTGESEIVVGTPIAGRNRLETEGLIGFFVNTLALRGSLAGGPSLDALLALTRETVLAAHAHGELPFELLVEELNPRRSLSHTPLFQVMLSLEAGAHRLDLPGLSAATVESVPAGVAPFDLTLSIAHLPDLSDSSRIACEYSTDLFDATTVARLHGHLREILKTLAAAPGTGVHEVALCSAAERHQVLTEWNDTAAEPVFGRGLHGLFETWARERPEAPAVLFEAGAWSYAELSRRAGRLAHRLRGMGVDAERVVGVLAGGGPELALGMLGVLKAGGAFLPLDPAWPVARREALLADAGARVLLGCWEGGPEERLPPGCAALRLDREEAPPEGKPALSVRAVSPEQAAYVIYTSGSTGRPKGVVVSHGAAVSFALEVAARCGLDAGERFLQFASPGFDVLIEEVFPAWSRGGAVVFAPREELLTPAGLERVLERGGVTAMELPTPYWNEWMDDLERRGEAPPRSLRLLLLGSEKPSPERLARWDRYGVPVIHVFGLTETTVTSTLHRWRGGAPGARELPIGRPVGNTGLYVLDREGAPVPSGVVGELYIGGIGVARGYLGRPGLTAERFVPDAWGGPLAPPGARAYRTGDLARYRADGELDFLGRLDHQVKVRGVRVEPGEVAAVLERHPAVAEAFVAVREASPGDRRLVAWVVPAAGASPGREELRAHAGAWLPEAMVPAEIVALPALPVTSNGKIDRAALPEPEWGAAGESGAAPGTPTEELLAGIWAAVLGRAAVGRDDDFFALGGHSLLAIQAVSRVRQALGVELPLRALFEAPTVAALARVVERSQGVGPPAPSLLPAARDGDLPLSFAQRRLWLLDRLEPGSAVYNVFAAVRLRGAARGDLLLASLAALVERHETLRTTFAETGSEPVQVVHPALPPDAATVDLAALAPGARERELRRLAESELRRPFDLARGPLLRARFVALGAGESAALLAMHHIVSDEWSMRVLVAELCGVYAALARGADSSPRVLPALPVQYADYAVWQRGWLQGEALEAQLRYWTERLAGAPRFLALPTDHPRRADAGRAGASVPLRLPGALVERLRRLGRETGATLYMTLLAAFQALLGRYAGEPAVSVGTHVAGRGRAEIEGLIGFFVNTLVLHTDLGGLPAGRALIGRVREAVLGAFSHQELPFEKLVERLNPERDPRWSPLFQVTFALQSMPQEEPRLPGVAVEPLPVEPRTAQFDLMASLAETAEGAAGALRYRTALFTAATVRRLAGHFAALLAGLAADPDRPVAELPLLDAAERAQLLVEWSGAGVGGAGGEEETLPALFAAQAARHPERPAVALDGVVLSYGELARRAARVARALRRLGVGPEVRVAVCLERSPDLLAALLGVMQAGGAYVPLDPATPSERLAFLLEDAAPAVVLTAAWLADALAGSDGGPAIAAPSPDQLAYVIYTSGSTGRPKGTLVRHGALTAFARGLRAAVPELRAPAPLRLSLNASFAFDASLQQIAQLAAGHTLWIVPEEARRDGERLAAWLRAADLDGFDCTPSQLELLLGAMEVSGRPPRFALVGGEAIPPALWQRLAGHLRTRFYNVYGPTECTVDATARPIDGGLPDLGRPLPGYRVHLLDAGGLPLPAGARGEIWIGGPALARGYHRRPDLTADRFRPDPFAAEPGERLYRTGDLGRWLPDGRLESLGRADQQVKLRGFRIEPGEIEAALVSHPAVGEAAVAVREAPGGDRRLVAWVTLEAPEAPQARDLRRWLAERLPEPMVPAAVVVLAALPRMASGKLDRKALPDPERAGERADRTDPSDPTDPTDFSARSPARSPEMLQRVLELFREVLGVAEVGPDDSFFELGGHSLSAVRLAARIGEAFGLDLPARHLFAAPTPRGLAALLRQAAPAASPGPRKPRSGPLPLSFAQQGLWARDRLSPGSTAYNIPAALRLRGSLNVPALGGALSAIVGRHGSLRTRFEIAGDQPVQVVAAPLPLALPVIDLAALPPARAAAEEARLGRMEAATPFDLGRPPLLRARLLRRGSGEHALLLTVHHIASDAWSMGVAVGELGALYRALATGQPAQLPALPLQYADFAAEERETLRGDALAREVAFWRDRLAGAPPLELPADRPRRQAAPAFHGAALERALPGAAGDLQRLARAAGATPFMALLAPFAALLARLTGTEDVAVGTTVTGRDRPELRDLIGFFVNTLVLRADLGGDPDGRGLLARARQTALDAFAHQLPFEALAPPPPLRALLQLLDLPRPGLDLPGLAVEAIDLPQETAKFDLVLNVSIGGEALRTRWVYDTDLFDRATVERFASAFATLFAGWTADPGRRLSELPLLTAAQRHQLLTEWNPGPPGALSDRRRRCLHRRFEEQAARAPEAVAVSCEGESLTYRGLDERAGRLAHTLLAAGARPGDRIALCCERSLEMIVALLAVLKTGAAYVPLDPASPPERLAFALEDSGARLLLAGEGVPAPAVPPGVRVLRSAGSAGQDGPGPLVPSVPSIASDTAADPDLPAYVIYTSGSTGRPKGVAVSHAQVDRLLTATAPWFGFGPEDVWTLFHSYAFDFSVWEIWGALAWGGRLVVVPFWVSRSPADFHRLLVDERVTVLNQTPSAFRQLQWADREMQDELALRLVVFGGEALEPAQLRPWAARHGLDRPALVNMYGITETTVHVTARPITLEDLDRGGRIGRPIPDLTLHVLDRRLAPQPPGVPGEICVGGAGLAWGYLGRPELTAERFVPDPFAAEPGARLYRSGDLARRLPHGDVEPLGRIDHQVKIRGFRIEPGEIEAALAAHPGVREAVVVARDDGPEGERRLVAYVVPAAETAAGAAAPAGLREHLAARLPEPMVPAAVVILPALPLTANGKIDRRALPAPDAAVSVEGPHGAAPSTDLERFLAAQIRALLGRDEQIGVDDDFFALGGNSISAAILVNRLQETLGEIVHVVVIFDRPTVASLAAYVVAEHPQAARRLWGEEGGAEETGAESPVGPADLLEMRRLVTARRAMPGDVAGDPAPHGDEARNPPALFVLSPPRSGSTLLRVMLGAHPDLFAPPELELLSFRSMAERRATFEGRDSFWLEGTIRAVMEARACTAEEAERILEETERAGWTTRRFYRELQGWIAPRMLVDKTPSYALDPEALQQAEVAFAEARYIHLVRHPQAARRSFEEARLDQVFLRRPLRFSRRQVAELVWTVSHQNILGFLAGIPEERRHTVRFEELVREPERVLTGVCDFLGLAWRPEMAEPYRQGVARMVDGPKAVSRMLGDVKFLGHGKVDATVAERWREGGDSPLGEPAREVAAFLGYATPGPGRGPLVPIQTGAPERRPLFCVHPVGGEVGFYVELAHRLGTEQPFYGLQTPDRPDGPLTDLPEMAAVYLQAVRQIQPGGPYRLAGWSLGGVIAAEMACQLLAQGEKVELLALIDTAAPDEMAAAAGLSAGLSDSELALSFAGDQAELFGLAPPGENLTGLGPDAVLARVLAIGRAAAVFAPGVELDDLRRLFERFRANRLALAAYRARPFPGEALLFRATERVVALRHGEDAALGWSGLITGGVRVYDVPGDHYSMLRGEGAARLAELLLDRLQDAHRDPAA